MGAPGDVPGSIAPGVGAASDPGWTTLGVWVSAPESEMVVVWAGATSSGPGAPVPGSTAGAPWLGASTALSSSSSLSATSTALITCGVAEIYKRRSSSSWGATSTGGEVRYSFNSRKALSASSYQSKRPVFLINLKRRRPRSPSLEMNLPRATMQPVRRCASFSRVGGCMRSIASPLLGSLRCLGLTL